eukprot:TRINITY_DN1063_c0_g3_i1.p1 TRINITY_DN1063_c0_g3~~TRINITY_DN1063_c0_g3_i1.p1  ORF type:complete len:183 (-),score=50.63 TRINITY_DN1063_c0_g3_i1:238-786(-)
MERTSLLDVSPFTVLEYIRSSVEILMSMKEDTSSSLHGDSQKSLLSEHPRNYEEMIRKFEEESREHIRLEQQLKLYIDDMQEQIDNSEKSSKQLKETLKLKAEEIASLKERLNDSLVKCDEMKRKIEILEKKHLIEESEKALQIQIDKSQANKLNDFNKLKRMRVKRADNDRMQTVKEAIAG